MPNAGAGPQHPASGPPAAPGGTTTDWRQELAVYRDQAADRRDQAANLRDQAADRRDALANERDAIADEREAAADRREELADRREQAADEREARLDLMTRAQGVATPGTQQRMEDIAVRSHEKIARGAAKLDRERAAVLRDALRANREQEARRRDASRAVADLQYWQQEVMFRSAAAVAKAKVLRRSLRDTASRVASIEEGVAYTHDGLAAGNPVGAGGYRLQADAAREAARRARDHATGAGPDDPVGGHVVTPEA